nr:MULTISPECIES: VOC family protein [unclassified Cryobacterium]
MRLAGPVLSSPEPRKLADFYLRMLPGWTVVHSSPDFIMIRPEGGGTGIHFHVEQYYVRPVWPSQPGEQLQMTHLDIAVRDLSVGVEWAKSVGAVEADYQPSDSHTVMLDPDGHPFCLFEAQFAPKP